MSGWRRVRVRLRHDPVRLGPVGPTARHGGWGTPDGIAALVELGVGTSLRADPDVRASSSPGSISLCGNCSPGQVDELRLLVHLVIAPKAAGCLATGTVRTTGGWRRHTCSDGDPRDLLAGRAIRQGRLRRREGPGAHREVTTFAVRITQSRHTCREVKPFEGSAVPGLSRREQPSSSTEMSPQGAAGRRTRRRRRCGRRGTMPSLKTVTRPSARPVRRRSSFRSSGCLGCRTGRWSRSRRSARSPAASSIAGSWWGALRKCPRQASGSQPAARAAASKSSDDLARLQSGAT
jgi:hypothetical protein